MNAIVKASQPLASNPLMPTDMRSAMDLANMMATAKLVPTHLQGKPGDCLLVIEQSMRWGMSPFAVAQATSVISGKLMFEGKLVSAALNASGILSNRMTYEYDGEGPARAVTASATIHGEREPRTIRCTLAEAKTTNGMWTKQPDQQLVYFATRAWARRHAPEVMLGVYSPEEFDTPPDTFRGTTLDAAPEAPAHPTPKPAPAASYTPPAEPRRTIRDWLNDLRLQLAAAHTLAAVDAIATSDEVMAALRSLRNGAREELNALLAEAIERTTRPEGEETDVDSTDQADDDTFPGDLPLKPAATEAATETY